MTKHLFPTNDIDRITTLNRLVNNSQPVTQGPQQGPQQNQNPQSSSDSDVASGNSDANANSGTTPPVVSAPLPKPASYSLRQFVPTDILDALHALAPVYESTYTKAKSEKYRAREVQSRAQKRLGELASIIRDVWAGLRRRARRLEHPEEILGFFLMPGNAEINLTGSSTRWVSIANQVLDGDVKAVEAGLPSISNPSVQEVRDLLEMAQAAVQEADNAKADALKAQKELAKLRGDARTLYSDLTLAVRFALRRESPLEQRSIMRVLGFHFLNEVSEEVTAPETETPSEPASDPSTTEGQLTSETT